MIAFITMTLSGFRRSVSMLALMVVTFTVWGQETEKLLSREKFARVPDVVIFGADEIIIVPPLPVLLGGGIPVPKVDLHPMPFLPSPVGCESYSEGVSHVLEPVCIKLATLFDWLPFFLMPGDKPVPVMTALGVRYLENERDNHGTQNNGEDE